MKINWDAKLPGWYYFLLPLLFLFIFGEHIQTAWEWGESKIRQLTQTPEEQMLEEIAKSRKTLPEIRKEAEEGDARALAALGDAYSSHSSQTGLPYSKKIARAYYVKAYEKAIEQGNLLIRRHAAGRVTQLLSHDEYWGAEGEKWRERHGEAITEIEDREKADREKRIEEHKAMTPQ